MSDLGGPSIIVRGCENLAAAGFDETAAAGITWQALVASGSFVAGEWQFADDRPGDAPATLKVVGERVFGHPFWRQLMLGIYAAYPCVQSADVLSFVPDGPGDFAEELGDKLHKDVVRTRRTPGGSRHDFEYFTQADRRLAREADNVLVVEDVITSGSSGAATRRLFRPDANVHMLSMLLRGKIFAGYAASTTMHALVARHIPRSAESFKAQYGITPA